ncbi:prolyl 4-hydroxylase subunit alpha-3 [Petromyzon marinus]|uniref:prolyl 4-hydroxylase subunit alpha-3 n=1 Tax=Petromyzon marinus TaxID=7757 RepID=UPI003F6E6C44
MAVVVTTTMAMLVAMAMCGVSVRTVGSSAPGSDMFTALSDLQAAVSSEKRLVQKLGEYLSLEEARLEHLRRFLNKVQRAHERAYDARVAGTEGAVPTNPLDAFGLIKRLHLEWARVVHSPAADDNMRVLEESYAEGPVPGAVDLEGAARALMRAQDVYALDTRALAAGRFRSQAPSLALGATVAARLSADDCFHLGKVAYEEGDWYHSLPWLELSALGFRARRGSPRRLEDHASMVDALDHLAFTHFKIGNIQKAMNLSAELLSYEPAHQRVLKNLQKYVKMLGSAGEREVAPSPVGRPRSTHPRTRDAYEYLCRTHGNQRYAYRDPRFGCSYEDNGSPLLRLQPVKQELLSLRPRVLLFHDFVRDHETERIKQLAAPMLQRSVVASSGQQTTVSYRISKSAWLKQEQDAVIRRLDRRVAAITGLDTGPQHAEQLQVSNYGIAGHYEPHYDHATSENSSLYRMPAGNRVASILIYLSSVEVGGSTAFIYKNFSVPVIKNAAVFWWNLKRSGEADGDTLHAGCPVLVGNKWVANKWVRAFGQEFCRPCSLDPRE